jgi:hypothetical protein
LSIKSIIDSYIKLAPESKNFSEQCLSVTRWDGNVVLMVLDAAFTSTGLHYFHAVVPGLNRFKKLYLEPRSIRSIDDIPVINSEIMVQIWRNSRAWHVAISIMNVLSKLKQEKHISDREALKFWANMADLKSWLDNPIVQIHGVGINTFQYMRMMGGVDTVMPDRIVKKVFAEIMSRVNRDMPSTDIEFINSVEHIVKITGYKATELCWMTWLLQKA